MLGTPALAQSFSFWATGLQPALLGAGGYCGVFQGAEKRWNGVYLSGCCLSKPPPESTSSPKCTLLEQSYCVCFSFVSLN